MKGSEGIASLKLETLNKLIQKFPKAPSNTFSNMFPTTQYESDTIRWEVEYGSAGMTPFVAPGATAPTIGLDGTGEASASCAFFKEKIYFDEEFLNNLREPGSWATFQTAEKKLARGLQKLNYRCDRRREWMLAKMLLDGSLTYTKKGGVRFTVSYGVPSTHLVTLTTNYMWGTGSTRNPMGDIMDGKIVLADDAGVPGTGLIGMCNSQALRTLMFDSNFQTLLQKSAFGEGDLFKNPSAVIGNLLGVGQLMINDDQYEIPGWLTGAVTGSSTTTISVDDVTDMEAGGKLRFHDVSEANVWEDEVISSVSIANSTVTVATAPTLSFKANEDKVTMKKKFIPDNKFFLFSTSYEGQPIGEMMEAPYGMQRRWGKYIDRKDEWDPEGVWIRVQDKCLPVMYHPDTTYVITFKA
jgi:hypothetical protein